jgi:hypothetical protein
LEALGRAFTRWQHVETALYLLGHGLMRTSPEVASIAFFHIRSATNKVVLLDKLCAHVLSESIYRKHWVPLRKSLANPIEIRNSMAHFEIVWIDDEHAKSITELNVMIYTHHLDTHSNSRGGKGLTVEALRQATTEFKSLSETIVRFIADWVPDWPQQEASLPLRLQQYLQTVRKTGSAPEPLSPLGSSPD